MVHRPKDCPYSGWWIIDLYVRMRFRGLGLGSVLLRETLRLLKESGADLVRTSPEGRFSGMESFWLKSGFFKGLRAEYQQVIMSRIIG